MGLSVNGMRDVKLMNEEGAIKCGHKTLDKELFLHEKNGNLFRKEQ